MGMFAMRKPRGFHHSYIYVDERKEKLAKMEEDAKRELGMLPEKEFSPVSLSVHLHKCMNDEIPAAYALQTFP